MPDPTLKKQPGTDIIKFIKIFLLICSCDSITFIVTFVKKIVKKMSIIAGFQILIFILVKKTFNKYVFGSNQITQIRNLTELSRTP